MAPAPGSLKKKNLPKQKNCTEIGRLFPDFYEYTGNEYNTPSTQRLLEVLSQNQKPFNHSVEINDGSSSTLLLSDEVSITINCPGLIKDVSYSIKPLDSNGNHIHRFLNVGYPVWALDFSAPINYAFKNHNLTEYNEIFSVLAVGGMPYSQPVSKLNLTEIVKGTGLIQLWKIPLSVVTKTEEFIIGIKHDGVYCRSLSWSRYSSTTKTIGLLWAVFGDGSINCYNIPLNIVESLFPQDCKTYCAQNLEYRSMELNPIWKARPDPIFTCVSPAPFYIQPLINHSEEINQGGGLRVAAGTNNGDVYIWTLTSEPESILTKKPIIIHIASKTTITSISWAPQPDLELIVVTTSNGKLRVWDIRRSFNGCLYELEGYTRPMYNVCWSSITRFIYICHVGAWIFNSFTKECTKRMPDVSHGNAVETTIANERPPWSCSSLGHLALFACDNGTLLITPVNHLDRHGESSRSSVTWEIQEPSHNYEQSKSQIQPLRDKHFQAYGLNKNNELEQGTITNDIDQELLQQFYADATNFYSVGIMSARHRGLRITVRDQNNNRVKKKIAKVKKGKDTIELENVLHQLSDCARLHSVATLDPIIYPSLSKSIIASGGSAGIVHLFNPAEWNMF